MKRRASASVYGTGMIGIQRWISGSWQAAAMAGASSARNGRSVTTPSLSGGLGGTSFSGMSASMPPSRARGAGPDRAPKKKAGR